MLVRLKEFLIGKFFGNGIKMDEVKPDPEFPDKDYYPFFYCGIKCEQNSHIFHFLDTLNKQLPPPKQIIELGYRAGGFTLLLDHHRLSRQAKIYAYDKIVHETAPTSEKVERRHGDVFHMVDNITEIIQRDGLTLLFCDGGDKNGEYNVFAPRLKEGDIIMTHDYAPNRKVWEDEYLGKKWDWFESWDGEMTNTSRDHNLVDFCTKEANDAVWSCKRKYNMSI